MPIVLELSKVVECAEAFAGGMPLCVLGGGVRVALSGGRLAISDMFGEVFHMRMAVDGERLVLDSPFTPPDERGRFRASAAVEIDGIEVVLASLNKGIYDLEQFRIFGIEPTAKSVLVVKCMQGHHAAFDPIGSRSIDVDSGA